MPKKITTEQFIEKARKIHGDKYYYSKVEYTKANKILVGSRTTEFTLVDYPTMDDRCESNLKSSDRVKQEVGTKLNS